MCTLLVAEGSRGENLPAPPSATPGVMPPVPPSAQEEYDDEDDEDDEDDVIEQTQDGEYTDEKSRAMHEIMRFIAGMRSKRVLSKEQAGNFLASVVEASLGTVTTL